MKKTTTLLTAAAFLTAACAAETDPAQQYREALPTAAAVQVGTPQDEAPAGALSVRRDALGDTPMLQSEYAVQSYYLALTMNVGVGWTLAFLRTITLYPPTSCDDASCTWGPWIDDDGLNRWMLNVAREGGGYAYALSGQPGSDAGAPFVALISGTAFPADRDHGSGTFTIDFDAQDALDHGPLWEKHDFGSLVVNYDNTHGAVIGAVFTGARNDDPANPHLLNASYAFDETARELQLVVENLDTTEAVSLGTRWSPGGAGRSDAHYNGPDGAGGRVDYFASECWAGHSQDFEEVYDSKHTEIPALADQNACSPFMTPDYVALP